MPYRKIVLAHDGSPLADAAVQHAIAIARPTGADVVVVHVIESVPQVMAQIVAPGGFGLGAAEVAVDVAEDIVADARQRATDELAHVNEALHAAGIIGVRTVIKEGPAGSTILETAKEEQADLIVIATHGRSGLRRVVMGSVADHVVRHATCPVLVCRSAP